MASGQNVFVFEPKPVSEKLSADTTLLCNGCNTIFRSKGLFESHLLSCPNTYVKSATSASFFNVWNQSEGENKKSAEVTKPSSKQNLKVIPPSQPLRPLEESYDIQQSTPKCDHCLRPFSTTRGLNRHLKSCPKKGKTEKPQSNPTVTTTVTNEVESIPNQI